MNSKSKKTIKIKMINLIKCSVVFLMIFFANITLAQGNKNYDSPESNTKNTSSNLTMKIRVKKNQGQAIWIKGVPVLISNVLPLAA